MCIKFRFYHSTNNAQRVSTLGWLPPVNEFSAIYLPATYRDYIKKNPSVYLQRGPASVSPACLCGESILILHGHCFMRLNWVFPLLDTECYFYQFRHCNNGRINRGCAGINSIPGILQYKHNLLSFYCLSN